MTNEEKQAFHVSYFTKQLDEGSRSKLEEMVIRILKKYGQFAEKHYDYFFDDAVDTYMECIESFNPTTEKSSFDCYLKNCLGKRMCSTATMLMAQKRMGDTFARSIDRPDDEDSDFSLENVVGKEKSAEDAYMESQIPDRLQKYLNSLSAKQKKIAVLLINGFDQQAVMALLNLDYKQYEMHMRLMGDFKKIKYLMRED